MNVILEVKPEGPDVNMSQVCEELKLVFGEHTGVIWQEMDLVPVAFGVQKARIRLQVSSSDEIDALCDTLIEGFEGTIQSVDWERA